MNETILSRIKVLLAQQRYIDADKLLKESLQSEPNDVLALSLMTEVQLELDQIDQAAQSNKLALALNPAIPHLFYLKSRIAIIQKQYDIAEQDIREAISLDPEDADYYAFHASIKLHRKDYTAALELANHALTIDAENLLALNMRSTALLKLDRPEDSFNTIEGALRENPNNPYTHANYGWNLLEKGNHKKALMHFKESLLYNPNYEYAQAGMAEAMKANNIIYRGFLKYSFWIGNLSGKFQIIVFVAFIFSQRILRYIAEVFPAFEPFILPIIILLAVFAFSTWVISPISNLMLRLSPYGRYLLKKHEIQSSTAVGICAAVSILALITYLFVGSQSILLLAGIGFTMMIPSSRMFANFKANKTLFIYAIGMAVIGIVAVSTSMITGAIFNGFTTIYLIAFIAYQWIVNLISIKQGNP